jgi:hypothetical protein
MKIKELTVKATGPMWRTFEVEIEAIDLFDKWEDADDGASGSVSVKDFALSPDDILDVFIHFGAPNGTEYGLAITGKIDDGGTIRNISFSKKYKVERNGHLRISVRENVNDLIIP